MSGPAERVSAGHSAASLPLSQRPSFLVFFFFFFFLKRGNASLSWPLSSLDS